MGFDTPNVGIEVALNPKLSVEVSGAFNPWTFGSGDSNKKMVHLAFRPEIRFWPYEVWDGHFLGIHSLAAFYNTGGIDLPLSPFDNLKDNRYEGYAAGVGFSYGYQWYLATHWNIEVTAGIGYLYLNYDRYECRKCGERLGSSHKHWLGPTNLGVSFIYLFKKRDRK
ncbi:MAG: DUF3575 domain-containing protein [Rikenellaceae bacterium]|nr:DUF3575 domain-containing protein [Rikenellaceae bacterium]